jgi:serine phosphatase RsbU (regulator of sigma subunit)
MSLRLRLIVAFFLLSVVPLGAVTWYTYRNNAKAIRSAAGREAERLAGDLSQRMQLVTAQLTQRVERLMVYSAEPDQTPPAPAVTIDAGAVDPSARGAAEAGSGAQATDAAALASEQVSAALGEAAMLLNNIEIRGVRGFGGRGGRGSFTGREGGGRGPEDATRSAPESGAPAPARSGEAGIPPNGRRDGRGRGQPPGEPGAQPPGAPPAPPQPDADRTGDETDRIRIDLAPVRRELLQELMNGSDARRLDELSPEERSRIFSELNQRMLGIQQGIQMAQQKVAERLEDKRAEQSATAARSAGDAAAAGDTAASAARPAPPAPAPASRAPAPSAPAAPAPPSPTAAPDGPSAPMQRTSALSGSRLDVRMERNGEVVGEVNAEINLPNLLATVFAMTGRDRGEVPFAVGLDGALYAPTPADRELVERLAPAALQSGEPPRTNPVGDLIVVTTLDPTGSGLTFGIVRPVGEALQDLRRSAAQNVALGLGLIGLALIGMVPLSSRLTRNLSRLSEGVRRIAQGDYRARVDVRSTDEVGALARAFNQMAEHVERHQHAAVEQERLRRELELGRQIQHDMLPQAPLRLGSTEINGVSVPAREVGGDFFNYFQTRTGAIALLVGDVSGKGVGAAILMANLQASLRTRLALGQDLADVARELDADLLSSGQSAYATLFVGLLDPGSRTFRYVSAGHNPQYVRRRSGGLEPMEASGPPIGLIADGRYTERRLQLAEGDLLFFYTDGCVETESQAGEMFGATRLEGLLVADGATSADDLLALVQGAVTRFRAGREPFDDATMMAVRVG